MRQTGFAVSLFFFLLLHSATPSQPTDWRYYGGDAGSTKYAPLAQIDRDNFADLRIIWRWRPPEVEILAEHDVDRNYYRSTPVVINGVLYVSSPFGIVAALNAATGEELWKFDPESWCLDGWFSSTHRGVAYWEEGRAKRVLFGTTDGYLYSLDAGTGRPDPAFGDSGSTALHKAVDTEDVELIRYLLERGAATTIGDVRWGETPYDWTGYYGNGAHDAASNTEEENSNE